MAMERWPAYDVFLSHVPMTIRVAGHRGLLSYTGHQRLFHDVGNTQTYVYHLYKALRQAGYSLGRSDDRLEMSSYFERYSNLARVHVALITPKYAHSRPSLDELCGLMACDKPLIPVYYNVQPEYLCSRTVGRSERQNLLLKKVAAIKGLALVNIDDDTTKIVDAVMARLALSPPSPVAHQVPLGMKESSSLIIDMLKKMEENVGVVGICGKAGIGKTTLAMEVYNHERYSRFDFGYCFLSLPNMKACKRRNVKALLDSVFKHDFEQIFRGEKIFLVIDGVVKKKQFDQLVFLNYLTPGSRVLITSRDNILLKKILKDAPQGEFYEVSTLNKIDSLLLFQRCIFHSKRIDAMDFALPSTSKGDAMDVAIHSAGEGDAVNVALHSAGKRATVDVVVQNLTKDIASACQGLPLALEVMGGFLSDKLNFSRDAECWIRAATALQKGEVTTTSLQISYDDLVLEDKVSLQIIEEAGKSLSPYYDHVVYKLQSKYLVKMDAQGFLRLHDLVRNIIELNELHGSARLGGTYNWYFDGVYSKSKLLDLGAGLYGNLLDMSLLCELNSNGQDHNIDVGMSIPIISEDYAKSKSCLDHLSAMLKSKRPLLPVFIDIKREDMLLEDGPFAEAFNIHVKKGRGEDVARWKNALREVALVNPLQYGLQKFHQCNDIIAKIFMQQTLQKCISTIISSLGIQTPYKVRDLPDIFQSGRPGCVVGRFNSTTMKIQVFFSNLKTLVGITGVGFDFNHVVLVTLGEGKHDPRKVTMTEVGLNAFHNLWSSGDSFYMLDFGEDQSPTIMLVEKASQLTLKSAEFEISSDTDIEEQEEDHGSHYIAYRIHSVAKLLLLLRCKDHPNHPVNWSKVKDFLSVWNWKDLKVALFDGEDFGEERKNIPSDVQSSEKRSGDGVGASTSGKHNSSGARSESSRSEEIMDGKRKISGDGEDCGDGDDCGDDKGGKDDDEGHDARGQISKSSDSPVQECSIEVRPGHGTLYEEIPTYKRIEAYVTPHITVTFRNFSNVNMRAREIHVKMLVNFDLAGNTPPDPSDMNQFSWYQDRFGFSIQSRDEDAAALIPDSRDLVKNLISDTKSTITSTSKSNSSSRSTTATAGLRFNTPPVMGGGQISHTKSGGSTSSEAGKSDEIASKQTRDGFVFSNKFTGGPKPSIGGVFTYRRNIEPPVLQGDGKCQYITFSELVGVCSSQAQEIEGSFQPLEDWKDYNLYTFKSERDIKGWFWVDEPQAVESNRKRSIFSQASGRKMCWKNIPRHHSWGVGIHISHGMKHVHKLIKRFPDGIPYLRRGELYKGTIKVDEFNTPTEEMDRMEEP